METDHKRGPEEPRSTALRQPCSLLATDHATFWPCTQPLSTCGGAEEGAGQRPSASVQMYLRLGTPW